MAWLVSDDRKIKNKEKESDQEYLLWLNNPVLWKQIQDTEQGPDDERNAIPIAPSELGEVERFLQNLDQKKQVSNKTLEKWTDWM